MFKKLWKMVRSDEKVMQALSQTSVTYDLSPDFPSVSEAPANNNEALQPKKMTATVGSKSKLCLQDWSERDEERLKKPQHWEGYTE